MVKVHTQAQERVRVVAEKALLVGELKLKFHASSFGSVEGAKAAARGFQTSFASLRARDRRRTPVPSAHGVFADPKSEYDKLVCASRPMADGQGWEIHMSTSPHSDEWEVCDGDGNPLIEDAWADAEVAAFVRNAKEFAKDPERLRRLLKARPALGEELGNFGVKHPDEVTSLDDLEPAVKVKVPSSDFADMASEDMFGDGQ